jgi:hypothetical protein
MTTSLELMLLSRSQVPPNVQVFTSSGTWTMPTGAVYVLVEVQGGGGGTGGCPTTDGTHVAIVAGAGGGEYGRGFFAASALNDTVTVTVGAAGAAGTSGTGTGGTGGTSSFGAYITAVGGTGSSAGSLVTSSVNSSTGAANGGSGGTGGDFHVPGSDGGNGVVMSGFPLKFNSGGGSVLSGTRRPAGTATGAPTGFAGYDYGGGASGAFNAPSQSAQTGSVGGQGIVIVTSFFMA